MASFHPLCWWPEAQEVVWGAGPWGEAQHRLPVSLCGLSFLRGCGWGHLLPRQVGSHCVEDACGLVGGGGHSAETPSPSSLSPLSGIGMGDLEGSRGARIGA